jgi:DNA-binding winged helix-turn-helix (wHTH) protein/Tol biopolymer transport system component
LSSLEPHSGHALPRQYAFAGFTLDLERGVLRRGVKEVTLRPKSFEVLVYLVEHHGQLVTKARLIEAVWPDIAVTDNSLAQCLVEIRRALSDDSQQLIRTVARRGYLFRAPVTTPVVEFPRLPAGAEAEPARLSLREATATRSPLNRWASWIRLTTLGAFAFGALAASTWLVIWLGRPAEQELTYTQITNFTDSAVSPALSPDGRMLAFFRSNSWWLTPDQIYVKVLPNGEPFQITHDSRPKYGLAFSPDGSRIAYTAVTPSWTTFTVPLLSGEPTELLSNAAGLTWLDERRILFSEIGTFPNMGIVTATESRSEYRKIYFPQNKRGMAHLSYASPDRKWALVVEMDPVWQPCRVIPLDGSSAGRQVGPKGECTSAAWSPDGKWMYFGVEVEGSHHLWRQQFPAGEPEQITSGPTEQDGVAVAPDGRSLITSIGIQQTAVWIHDARGDRQLSSEGYVPSAWTTGLFGAIPTFSRDGKLLFYLKSESRESAAELWRTHLESDKSEKVLPGFSMREYDVSSDGREVVFSTLPSGKPSQLWLAPLDRSSPPQLIAAAGEDSPHFGPDGQILFRLSEDNTHYLAQMNRNGSGRSKVVPYPIGNIQYISPDRRWITAIMITPGGGRGGTFAVPIAGGAPRRICPGCFAIWAPDGKFLYLGVQPESRESSGKTAAIPLRAGEMVPDLPGVGFLTLDGPLTFRGSRLIDVFEISPGPAPSIFAHVKTTMHRNLFRIPLPTE